MITTPCYSTSYVSDTTGPTVPHYNCTCGRCTQVYSDGAPVLIITKTVSTRQKVIDDQKATDAYYKWIYDFESQQNTFKQGLKLKTNYRNPKTINRKLSQYSCVMRGRNKPCRRVAIVNQE